MKNKMIVLQRPFEKIRDIDNSKSLWRVAVRVKDLWIVRHAKSTKHHTEMVLCDDLGDEIQMTVPTDLHEKCKTQFHVNMTCTIQNFDVEKNNLSVKACEHKFKLIWTGGSFIEDVNEHKIPKPGFKFKDFADIKNGIVRSDLLIDVIGAFHELGYTQLLPGGRKLQVNFKLKDLAGNILNCTLWEDFATQFAKYNNERTDWGPTIVLIHNARIKEATDQFELGISNVWNGTQLFINDDIPEIIAFKESLSAEESCGNQSQQLSCQSQMLTQSSPMTQQSSGDKFLNNALILPLPQILALPEPASCVTVVTTNKILPTKFGWYYKLCGQCPRSAKGDTLPLKCEKDHETYVINLRYKIDVEAEYEGVKTTLVFWDRECNELIGHTAAELHTMMVEGGITNPLVYPVQLDNFMKKTLACKIKLQLPWGNYSVQGAKADQTIIQKVLDHFPKNEGTSKLAIASSENIELEEVSASDQMIEDQKSDKDEDFVFPTVNLSDSSEYDPDHIPLTPAKRTATNQSVPQDLADALPPTKSSSSKTTLKQLKKNIKREKNP
ncbi:hypothetical protein L195_g024386 [Trifolium pratense]|uniref:Replication protein A 70 kDa DNA-binding subunit B/D first OB fold domain-containing protein n=1 Tax=Trifolium pratense TaxID=57577 RepID=A0A2K3NDH9_TRIPR|nr:hypothetical protein L195_g024386 [Trifolium pratense]